MIYTCIYSTLYSTIKLVNRAGWCMHGARGSPRPSFPDLTCHLYRPGKSEQGQKLEILIQKGREESSWREVHYFMVEEYMYSGQQMCQAMHRTKWCVTVLLPYTLSLNISSISLKSIPVVSDLSLFQSSLMQLCWWITCLTDMLHDPSPCPWD